MTTSIQDRTVEFRAVVAQAKRKQNANRPLSQRPLLSDSQRLAANGSPVGADGKPIKRTARSQFARDAAQIGRAISATMDKLQRLAQLARRKTLFDDRPVEIAELTYIIKQDLSQLNSQIASLQALSKASQPQNKADQEKEHHKNVIVLLQERLANVGVTFKDVLEVRTKNIQASRSRTDQFVASVSASSAGLPDPYQSASPLYNTTPVKSPTPSPGYAHFGPGASGEGGLGLDPGSEMGLPSMKNGATGSGQSSEQQALLLEEGSNAYISQRGEMVQNIERTINELGGIFAQLATMVSEQGEAIARIDANTEDVVDNVEGAQRELMKYWSSVKGNRWLVAKMFGVLMIFFLIWVLVAG